jgi:hypothetical protein
MDIALEPDVYSPSIDENGNYMDKAPSFNNIKSIRCPCGTRKDKAYDSLAQFSCHVKTKTHQKWISDMNMNRSNYFVECEHLKQTVHSQQLIIARMEQDISAKTSTINYLAHKLYEMEKNNNNKNISMMD